MLHFSEHNPSSSFSGILSQLLVSLTVVRILTVGAVQDTDVLSSTTPVPAANTHAYTHSAVEVLNREVYLTPWWSQRFAEGETAEIDCGFFTDGHPENFNIRWLGADGQLLETTPDSRISLINQTSDLNAYTVITLRMRKLTEADAGSYVCNVTDTSENTYYIRNITLNVIAKENKAEYLCGFESEDLCGWTTDSNEADISWHRHRADEPLVINRQKGPRFDHTYGSSKHVGHFMDTDLHHVEKDADNDTLKARLVSPVFEKHDHPKCLEFWYMFEGKDQEHLRVILQPTNSSNTVSKDILVLDSKEELARSKEWQRANVTIFPQGQDYQISIESLTCSGSCINAAAGLDDVRIRAGKCNQVENDWSENVLPVRLVNGSTPYEGRVEVLHDGQWGTICSTGFGDKDAKVICQNLNFGTANLVSLRTSPFGTANDNVRIWLGDLDCEFKGRDLGSCLAQHMVWGEVIDCTHDRDAAVRCSPPVDVAASDATFTDRITASETSSATVGTTTARTTSETSVMSVTTGGGEPTPGSNNPTETKTEKPAVTPSPSATSLPFTTTSTSTTTQQRTTTRPAGPTKTVTSPTKPTKKTTGAPDKKPTPASTSKKEQGVSGSDVGGDVPNMVSGASGAGVAIGIIVVLFLAAAVIGIMLYRRRKTGRKNAYITFGNPSYSKEHLPANDFSLESPLTLSSNGYTVLA